MVRLHLTNRLLAFAVGIVLAASLTNWAFTAQTIRANNAGSIHRNFLLIARNARTLRHLCVLENISAKIWARAVHSYETLPVRTSQQIELLRVLRLGVAQVEHDQSCITILKSVRR